MAKDDNPVEEMRIVTAATLRAIARRPDLTLAFTPDPPHMTGTEARLPLPTRDLPSDEVAELRGQSDSLALQIRHHDEATHNRRRPQGAVARAIYDAVETARCEALGANRMAGVKLNLEAAIDRRCKDEGYATVDTREEAAMADAIGLLTREALQGTAPPATAKKMVDAFRPWLESKIGKDIEALSKVVDDQEAYARIARRLIKDLQIEDEDSEEGEEYWQAMQLMGRYAAANHACIHRHVARGLGAKVLLDVENHHNFAWEEEHQGERLIVHRKGATPAGDGVFGIIPGSMASPAYVVRGLGNAASLRSAAHGAGRVMSRKKANHTFTWSDTRKLLASRGVELLSAGLDEVPGAYRDIDKVMAAQADLVQPLARFHPRIVKMAPAGERPED